MLHGEYDVPCDEETGRSDAELVRRVLDGEEEAFETLLCRYGTQLFRHGQSIVENESDAQDVYQKALVKMHRKLDSLRKPSSFRSWAYRIVRNQALMKVRRDGRNDVVGFGDLGAGHDDERFYESLGPEWRNRGDEAAEIDELRSELIDAIESLEPKYQSPFVLYEFEGAELEEIGDVLNLSVAGVKSRLHRARLQLRAELERYLRDGLPDELATE